MNTFVFGDVHGDSKALSALLRKAREEGGNDIQIYSIGDLLDRGPDSKGVVDLCVREGVQGVIGNHELWLHNYLSMGVFEDFALSPIMGGKKTLLSYGVEEAEFSNVSEALKSKIPPEHAEYFCNLSLTITLNVGGVKYRLTHGGIPRKSGAAVLEYFLAELEKRGIRALPEEISDNILKFFAQSQSNIFLWAGAKKGEVFSFPDGSFQIFGHTPWKGGAEINVEQNYIALDTGCGTCPPFKLSGVLLLESGERKILTSK